MSSVTGGSARGPPVVNCRRSGSRTGGTVAVEVEEVELTSEAAEIAGVAPTSWDPPLASPSTVVTGRRADSVLQLQEL